MMEVQAAPTRIKAEQSLLTDNDEEPHHLSPQIHAEDIENDGGVDVERGEGENEGYELTELKTMSSSKQERQESPMEELTEDHDLEQHTHTQQKRPKAHDSNSGDSLNFKLSLIDSVSRQPCLYDPMDPNYNSRTSVYRNLVWQKLVGDLSWNGDIASLQKEWKQLRDRFVRNLRKINTDPLLRERHPSDGDEIIEAMQWLTPFIGGSQSQIDRGVPVSMSDHSPASSLVQSSSSLQSSRDNYFAEPQTMDHDVMISGYQSQSSSHSMSSVPTSQSSLAPHRSLSQQQNSQPSIGSSQQLHGDSPTSRSTSGSGSSGPGYYILRTSAGSSQAFKIVNQNDSGSSSVSSSSSPRITVLPTTRTVNGNTILHLQPGQVLPRTSSRVHVIHTPSSSHSSQLFDHRSVSLSEPGVTVTASGNAGMIGHVKKDQQGNGVSMVFDPTPCFQNGSQKMYRLVMNDMHDGQSSMAPPLKRVKYGSGSRLHSQSHHHGHHHQSMVSLAPSSSRVQSSMQDQMGEEVIIDDGIQDRTIVIDQDHQDVNDPDSPLLSESPGLGSMMISGHQSVSVGQSRMQAGSSGVSQRGGGGGGMQHHMQHVSEHGLSTCTSPGPHPGYLQQSQYDADLQFQQLISTSLSRYTDDEKALMKWNIQRILLEARYGTGVCSRILQEEELSESAAGSVVAHEMVPQ